MSCHNLLNIILILVWFAVYPALSLPEQSQWVFELDQNNTMMNISRTVYRNTSVHIYLLCESRKTSSISYVALFGELACISAPLGINTEYRYMEEGMGEDNKYKNFPPRSAVCSHAMVATQPVSFKPPEADVLEYPSMESDTVFFIRIYLFDARVDTKLSVFLQFDSGASHLSPADWPLLPFYGTMCCVYAVYAVIWMVFCFRYWKDLLRIQHWIGAVIFLGMLEKAFFVAEYESVEKTGVSVKGVLITAELVSCLKRSLARMLFIIVSLGFGIVRPRLGVQLHRAVGVGCLYFIVSSADGVMRVVRHKSDSSLYVLIPSLLLSVIDSFICMWIFLSLMGTIRMLMLKKNTTKLALYRQFRNTLLFAIIVSFVFALWSSKRFTMASCITDWKNMWVLEAFWHVLFSSLLFVVMILWRPSANNQRYAYSPLTDSDGDVTLDQPINDAFDVKKTRSSRNEKSSRSENEAKTDDDLKWVEDNIPSSVLDIHLMDSDEERKDRLLHTSKME